MDYHEISRGPGEFVELCRFLLLGKGDALQAAHLAEVSGRAPRVTTILKSAIAAGTLANAGWAGNLAPYGQIADGFAESLRSLSVFDRMLGDAAMRRIPLRTRVAVTTVGATGGSAAEGAPKVISKLTLAGTTLEPVKASVIVVVSDELARFSGSAAAALLSRELRGALAAATDAAFLADLLAGAPSSASAGATATQILTDIATLLTAVAPKATSRLYLLTTPALASKLTTKADTSGRHAFVGMSPTGGELVGIPCLVSDAAVAGTLALIDASQVAGDSDVITLEASRSASLQLDTAPSAGATAETSLWQGNLLALRAERYFGSELLRASSVATITGAAY
jgi:HK97 family phage major capsid protein